MLLAAFVFAAACVQLGRWQFGRHEKRSAYADRVETHYSAPARPITDVIVMLRLQLERQRSVLFPSLGEYASLFGLNGKRLALAAPDAIVLHPGPMNRGVEITSEVADGPHSAILEQVGQGVAVRMAVLYLLAGARRSAT